MNNKSNRSPVPVTKEYCPDCGVENKVKLVSGEMNVHVLSTKDRVVGFCNGGGKPVVKKIVIK